MCSERSKSHHRSPLILVANSTSLVSRMLQYLRDSSLKMIRDGALHWVFLRHAVKTFTSRQFPPTCQPVRGDRMAQSVVAALLNHPLCALVLHLHRPPPILYPTLRLFLVLEA
jgi:hypothetical protein